MDDSFGCEISHSPSVFLGNTFNSLTMYSFRWAVAPSVLASLLFSTSQASALPVEVDSTCYMRTASGKVINLIGSMCNSSSSKPSSPVRSRPIYTPGSSNYSTGVSSVSTTVRGGVTTTVYSAPGRVSSPVSRQIYYPTYNPSYCTYSRCGTTSRGQTSTSTR
jgi:hypothetical protein